MLNPNTSNSAVLAAITLGLVSAFVLTQSAIWADSSFEQAVDDENEKPVSFTQIGAREENDLKIREGQLIKDEKAKFKSNGIRFMLHRSGDHRPLTVLENLALERVAEYISKSGANATWLVEGTITEYRGENYILLTRAHVNSLDDEIEAPPALSCVFSPGFAT